MPEHSGWNAAWADAETVPAADDAPPLTAAQARALRAAQPMPGPAWVVMVQAVVGVLLALLALAVSGRASLAWSVLYGAAAAAVPAAVMVRGLGRPLPRGAAPVFGAVRLLVWEAVKLALTVVLLALAPRLVAGLSWPGLLLGLVVCLKVYWLALLWRRH